MKSDSLLMVIGALAVKQKRCALRNRNSSRKKLHELYKLYIKMQETERVVRRFWVRDIFTEEQRLLQGVSNNLIREMKINNDAEKFFNFFRMSPETFNELLAIVGPRITKQNFIREAINPVIRLQLTLRYLASGDSMVSMQYLFRVGKNTVSNIIADTCNAIWDSLKDIVFIKPSVENWKIIANEFEAKWNFKNCIGAIDGKHVVMQVNGQSSILKLNNYPNICIIF